MKKLLFFIALSSLSFANEYDSNTQELSNGDCDLDFDCIAEKLFIKYMTDIESEQLLDDFEYELAEPKAEEIDVDEWGFKVEF